MNYLDNNKHTLHHKVKRNAKCTGFKNFLQVATLTVSVDGALTVPYGQNKAVEQIFYFCAQKSCFTKVPIWCNFKMPVELSCHEDVSQDEVNQFGSVLLLSVLLFSYY